MISSPFDSRSRRWLRSALALPAIAMVWGLAACGPDVPIEDKYPIERLPGDTKARYENPSSVFGQGGLFRRRPGQDRRPGRGHHRGQQPAVAGLPRHGLLHAAGLGRSLRRGDHHRLVHPGRDPGRAIQDQHLYPRPPASGRRHPGLGIPSGPAGHRLGRCAGGTQYGDRSGKRHPDARAPDAGPQRALPGLSPSGAPRHSPQPDRPGPRRAPRGH